MSNYAAREDSTNRVLIAPPNLDIGGNQVRLDGLRYHISLHLRSEADSSEIEGAVTRSRCGAVAPLVVIRGARGWLSGYVVPALSGRMTDG